jgi:hypothetical protein
MAEPGLAAFARLDPARSSVYSFENRTWRSTRSSKSASPRARRVDLLRVATTGYRRVATHWVMSAKRDETRERRLQRVIDTSASAAGRRHRRPDRKPHDLPRLRERMTRYNRAMNERLYECSARFPSRAARGRARVLQVDPRHAQPPASRRPHLDGALHRQPDRRASLAHELYADFGELRRSARRPTRPSRVGGGLTEESLAGTLRYTSIVNPEPRETPMGFAVAHFFNHQTHHRGQLTTLLFQRGIDPG